ncbi:MAG: putative thiol:disulfide interchange protein [Holophagaceae bacterium]|nr:putative thiol:disulfide interchange protein [Holophagaceae bacterium]
MRVLRWMLFLVLAALVPLAARAPQSFDPERDVSVVFLRGALRLGVPEGAHLKKAFMQVTPKPGTPGKLSLGKLPAANGKDELGDPIWRGTVAIPLHGEGLKGEVEVTVTYQPCTEGEGGVCFPPTDRVIKIKATDIPVARKEARPSIQGAKPQAPPQALVPTLPPPPPAIAPPAWRGFLWSLLLAFGFGLLASLTPCVYPMISITMAIIGAKGGGKLRGFALSLVLVLGMAVTYTLLGVLAARTGGVFGAAAQRPAFLIPVSILFALFAISLFGAFEIRLPDAIQSRLQGGPRRGWLGAFLMGLVLGPLAAPCVSPYLGTVLLTAAQNGHVVSGALQLFTFALGMGVLFVAAGTFTAALPRSGEWLVRLKAFMGLVILGFAVWNLRILLPTWANQALWSLTLLIGAPILGAFRAAEDLSAGLQKGLGILALSLAILLGVRSVEQGLGLELLPRASVAAPAQPSLWMAQDLEGATARAKAERKLVLVDTYAEWCAQCKELDEKTWPDARVQAWIQEHAVAVRIDTDRVRKDLVSRLGIRGYPTVLLLDAEGRELRRSDGFQGPEAMLAFLQEKGRS